MSDIVLGRVLRVNHRGRGTIVEYSTGQRYLVYKRHMSYAIVGDIVIMRIERDRDSNYRKRYIGYVTEVFSSKSKSICAKIISLEQGKAIARNIDSSSAFSYVIDVSKQPCRKGDIVILLLKPIVSQKDFYIEAKVLKILKNERNKDILITSWLFKNEISLYFSDLILDELKQVGKGQYSIEEQKKRQDFRMKPVFVIDPHDAKDHDDAIHLCQNSDNSLELGIHIADVTHYVKENSAIDKEAMSRGNSIYLPDRVIPMLPTYLSKDLCSLSKEKDKLTLSCVFKLDQEGHLIDYKIVETIIRPVYVLNYKQVQEIIDGKPHKIRDTLLLLSSLAKKWYNERIKNGGLNLDIPEQDIVYDEYFYPISVGIRQRLWSYRIIEECMLLANKTVAHYLIKKYKNNSEKLIYRVHDSPDTERLDAIYNMLSDDLSLSSESIYSSYSLQRIITKTTNTEKEAVVRQYILRAMAKACYQQNNIGHYGLSFQKYTHFTSPIRRYADILVHRLIKKSLHPTKREQEIILEEILKQINEAEVDNLKIEREIIKIKQSQYMESKIGKLYKGTVSGFNNAGMFVSLNENLCQGMVAYRGLGKGYVRPNISGSCLLDSQDRIVYRLGEQLWVKVIKTNVKRGQVDFKLID